MKRIAKHNCQRRNLWLGLLGIGIALSLTGCGKDDVGGAPEYAEIVPEASLPSGAVITDAGVTKAVVDPSDEIQLYFLRADEVSPGSWGAWGTEVLEGIRGAGDGNQKVNFSSPQYYLSDGGKSRMMGYAPGGAELAGENRGYWDATTGTVSWTIDGSQDILLAPVQEGSKMSTMPGYVFEHALSKVQFHLYAENGEAVYQWGRILGISVMGQRSSCSISPDDPEALRFADAATQEFSVLNLTQSVAPVCAKEKAAPVGDPVMIEPQSSGNYRLRITLHTEKRGVVTTSVAARSYAAGEAVKIYIRLAMNEVVAEPAITIDSWVNGMIGYYPYVKDGRIVVLKDMLGQGDQPLHPLWTITPEHSELAGDANASGYNIFAECFEVASQDIDPSPTSLDAAGACAAYSQASGAAGTWRVPTLQEMLLLTRLSKADELSAVEKIKVSGSSAVYYWTATKDANDNSRTWSVNTSTPHATSRDNNNPLPLRCVRDITPYENKAYPYVLEMQNGKSSDTYKLFVVGDYAGQLKNCALHEPWTETKLLVGRANYNSYDKNEMPISNMMRPASRILGKYSLDEAIEKCHMYFENSDESDRGTWRIPTITEVKMLFGIFFPDIHMDLPDVVSENYDVYGSATYTSNSRSQICSLLVQRDSDILEGPMGQLVSMPCYFFCVKDYE